MFPPKGHDDAQILRPPVAPVARPGARPLARLRLDLQPAVPGPDGPARDRAGLPPGAWPGPGRDAPGLGPPDAAGALAAATPGARGRGAGPDGRPGGRGPAADPGGADAPALGRLRRRQPQDAPVRGPLEARAMSL